jgi:hypothetical protein
MPIRQGGRFASLASSWRRETLALNGGAALVEADEVEGVLADVDTENGYGVFRVARQVGPWVSPPLDAGVLREAPNLLGSWKH